MKWLVTPTNEGQSMNYQETFVGPKASAIGQARSMAKRLQQILKKATICVVLKTNIPKRIYVYPDGEMEESE
jgi:hypothetical protein